METDSVDLKGGAIVSTATKDKNDLTTNRLTFSNIENQSQYDATTVSLSGGTSLGKGKSTGDSKASTPTNNDNWRNATSFSPSLPQHESDKDSSTTYATLSEGNITVGGKATTVEQLGIHSDAATASRTVETLPNLQTILDKQKTVADATSTIAAASRTYAQDQIKNAAAEKEAIGKQIASQLSPEQQAEIKKMSAADKDAYLAQYSIYNAAIANEKAVTQQWGMGGNKGRALNAVTTVITGALGGQTDIQVAANALAPYAANFIGEKFGHGEDKNKAAQLASHAILGATLAYLNGGNPAAGDSEAAVDYFANQYNDGKTYNYDSRVESMKRDGWNGDPVDIVIMPNGTATSMDNTRILAAREANIEVKAKVRDFNTPLTKAESERFKVNCKTPNTWGEAIKLRVEKQVSQKGTPDNWSIQFPYGSIFDPKVIKSK